MIPKVQVQVQVQAQVQAQVQVQVAKALVPKAVVLVLIDSYRVLCHSGNRRQ